MYKRYIRIFFSRWKSHAGYQIYNRNLSKFVTEHSPFPHSIISMKCSFGICRWISETTRQIDRSKKRSKRAYEIRSRCSCQVRKSLASNLAVLSGELYRCRTCRVPSGWILRPRGNYILGWNADSQQCEKHRKRADRGGETWKKKRSRTEDHGR